MKMKYQCKAAPREIFEIRQLESDVGNYYNRKKAYE